MKTVWCLSQRQGRTGLGMLLAFVLSSSPSCKISKKRRGSVGQAAIFAIKTRLLFDEQ